MKNFKQFLNEGKKHIDAPTYKYTETIKKTLNCKTKVQDGLYIRMCFYRNWDQDDSGKNGGLIYAIFGGDTQRLHEQNSISNFLDFGIPVNDDSIIQGLSPYMEELNK